MAALKNMRHEAFANLYARGVPKAEAFRVAGFTGRISKQVIWKLLQQPDIKARVAEIVAKAAAKNEITVARVLGEMAKLAFSDPETSPFIPASVKRQALVDLGKHLRVFEPDFNVNILNAGQTGGQDAVSLERIMIGLIEARRERERVTIDNEPAIRIVGERNADDEPPLRLVEPVPETPTTPPGEDKPQTTTAAYLEWANKPKPPWGSG